MSSEYLHSCRDGWALSTEWGRVKISEKMDSRAQMAATRKRKDILEGAIKGEKPGIDRGTYASGRKLAAGQF